MTAVKLISAALSAAFVAIAATGAQAHKNYYDSDKYRVVNLAGGKTVKLRSRRSHHAYVISEIPFNARQMVDVGSGRRGGWLHLRYRGETGWVHNSHVVRDEGGPTYYKVNTGRYRGLKIHRRPNEYSRVRGVIPNHSRDVVSAGRCEGAWCRVRFHDIRGWVKKHCLIVQRYEPGRKRYREDEYRSSRVRGDRDGYRSTIVRRWRWRDRY